MASSFSRPSLLGASSSHVHFRERSDDDTSSSSEDEQTRLRREDAEEEAALDQAMSDRFGEAAEAPARGEKRDQTEDEIAAEYEKKQKKLKTKRRHEPTIQSLTGANGLIRLPTEFTSIRYSNLKGKKNVKDTASYSLSLVQAYRSFCFDQGSSLAFEDALLKIERLGSKKELRKHLDQMRDDARNKYVEKLYGREKSEKMMQELDYGLRQQQHPEFSEEYPAEVETEARATSDPHMMATRQNASGGETDGVSPAADVPYERKNVRAFADEETEQEATFDDVESTNTNDKGVASDAAAFPKQRSATSQGVDDNGDALLAETQRQTKPAEKGRQDTPRNRVIFDDDSSSDEDVLLFDAPQAERLDVADTGKANHGAGKQNIEEVPLAESSQSPSVGTPDKAKFHLAQSPLSCLSSAGSKVYESSTDQSPGDSLGLRQSPLMQPNALPQLGGRGFSHAPPAASTQGVESPETGSATAASQESASAETATIVPSLTPGTQLDVGLTQEVDSEISNEDATN